MESISFFTPINYVNPQSYSDRALSILGRYFYLGGKRATVVKGNEVQLEKGKVSWYIIALKVASYFLLFPLTLTLFTIHLTLRYSRHFTVITSPQPSPPPPQPKEVNDILDTLTKGADREGNAFLIDFSKINPSNIFKIFDKSHYPRSAYREASISNEIDEAHDESHKFTHNFPFKFLISVVTKEENEHGYRNSDTYMFMMSEEGKVESYYGEVLDNFNLYLEHLIEKKFPSFEHLDFDSIWNNNGSKKLRKKSPTSSPLPLPRIEKKSREKAHPPPPFNISRYHPLVVDKKLDEIRNKIRQAKMNDPSRWECQSDYELANMCRDAILLDYEDIVEIFLDENLPANSHASAGDSGIGLYQLKYFAIRMGRLSILKLLMKHNPPISDTHHFKMEDDPNNVRGAIEGGHVEVVRYLLDNGGHANGFFTRFPYEQTFLGKAAADGQQKIVHLLVTHGASIKAALSSNNYKFRDFCHRSNPSDDLVADYSESVRMLLDYAIGIHFENEEHTYGTPHSELFSLLEKLDVTGFNFVGVSFDGQPVTREMLIGQKIKGAEKALITHNDIMQLEEEARRHALLERLDMVMKVQGGTVAEDEVVHLVPLANAAGKGLLDVVKRRLEAGVDPNQKTDSGPINSLSAIKAAAQNGFLEIVKLLAQHPNIDRKSFAEAAEAAQKKGHRNILNYLNFLIDINETDNLGDAPIHRAVKAENIEEIRCLLLAGVDINLRNKHGLTPLVIAIPNETKTFRYSGKTIDLITFLLENGADPNAHAGHSPLYYAAQAGIAKAVELLLPITKKENVMEIVDIQGTEKAFPWYVPLIFASYGSQEFLQILRLLKTYGADFNTKNLFEETLLYRLVCDLPSHTSIENDMESHRQTVYGCENRLDANHFKDTYNTFVENYKKIFIKKLEILDFLLENGADPSIMCGSDNDTALHVFIRTKNLEFIEGATEQMMERLCKNKIDTCNAYGFTPLHEAAWIGNLKAATYLVEKNANIFAETKTGLTPLHFAAAGKPNITQLLIDENADVNALDEMGRSPLAFSEEIYASRLPLSPEVQSRYSIAQRLLIRVGGSHIDEIYSRLVR